MTRILIGLLDIFVIRKVIHGICKIFMGVFMSINDSSFNNLKKRVKIGSGGGGGPL